MSSRILVIQLGKTGMSLVRYFSSRGCMVDVVDNRVDPPEAGVLVMEYPNIKVRKVNSYLELINAENDYDEIAVSPGVSPSELPANVKTIGDLHCFIETFNARWPYAENRPKLIAVTGTNGKSTVVRKVASMLDAGGSSVVAIGNIGLPMLDALQMWESESWPNFIIAELSSFQLAQLHRPLKADVACILNCTVDHLDWHGDLDHYQKSKQLIYQEAQVGIFNHQDEISKKAAVQAQRTIGFCGHINDVSSEWVIEADKVFNTGRPNLSLDTSALRHSGIVPASACAALSIVNAAASWQDTQVHIDLLSKSHGLPHRFEHVRTLDKVEYIDDSKATNIDATIEAIAGLKTKCLLIAGGDTKGQDLAGLAKHLQEKVGHIVLIGAEQETIARAFESANIPMTFTHDMYNAVDLATALAKANKLKIVLLSPACSSLDQYQNYEERGRAFHHAVSNLRGLESAFA